ncbi:MAG: cation:proton antiporter [Alphaproteobacteria bacterium]|nr:cation:proton antiporter [Alphaproteobacteria bacterium]MBO4643694.1 cation:proton antiporter [Alphaproteobacteria bacterium]
MSGDQVWEILAFLAAVVIFIPIFYRLKVNPLLAFIVAGIVLGPHGLRMIKDTEVTENIGEVGLLFLMFTIGLDLSFHRFKAMRLYIFGFGCLQLFVTAAVIGVAAYFMHRTLDEAIIIGLALAMSSTAIALKLIQERGELHTGAGRATVGILLMQDLAVIPILVLLPRMAETDATAIGNLGQAFTQAVGAVTLIMVVGRMLVKPLFRIVVSTKNTEAFTAVVFFTFLATAWATNMAGLSISLGAFLAGMLIAETDFGHEVEAEIASFSGMLLGIFFLSVGMMIDIHYVWKHIVQIVLLTIGVMGTKFAVLYVIERQMKVDRNGSMTSSVFLCQAGEFGFVVFNLAAQNFHLISPKVSSILQVVIALSMSLTPFVSSYVLKQLDKKRAKQEDAKNAAVPEDIEDEKEMENHVLLIGYGRVGQAAARMLTRNEIPFLVMDTDVAHIERAKKNNREYMFGNAGNVRILEAANISKAKAVMICISGLQSAIRVLQAVREMSSTIPVFIRCNDDARWSELVRLGATGVISETQECGIRLAAATILSLEGDEDRIRETAAVLRQENTLNASLPTAGTGV